MLTFLTFMTKACFHANRSGVSLAVKDNNGTFISTLSMSLFSVRIFSLNYTYT